MTYIVSINNAITHAQLFKREYILFSSDIKKLFKIMLNRLLFNNNLNSTTLDRLL